MVQSLCEPSLSTYYVQTLGMGWYYTPQRGGDEKMRTFIWPLLGHHLAGARYVAQAGLELQGIFLPQPPSVGITGVHYCAWRLAPSFQHSICAAPSTSVLFYCMILPDTA